MRLGLLVLALLLSTPAQADLHGYVARADSAFSWSVRANQSDEAGTRYRLALVSQRWFGIDWKHDLELYVPNAVRAAQALLFVGGTGEPELRALALRLQAPVASLHQVPNQPLLDDLYEDDLIAETFVRFLRTGDSDWPLLLPMTKSAVRAMDALQALSRERLAQPIERFVLTGASKRGWTAWLAAAVDTRVAGIAPRVIDMLNVPAQLPNQLQSWGRYSEMLSAYTQPGLPQFIATPPGLRLLEMIDPFAYREQLSMPKLILLGTNDRYWTLDALDLYWDALPGENRVLYVPNAGHGLTGEENWIDALACFFRHVRAGRALPEAQSSVAASAQTLRMRAFGTDEPARVRLWRAQAPTRDFREARWSAQPMERTPQGHTASVPREPDTWTAVFAIFDFERDGARCALSTRVSIHPPPQ